MQDPINHMLNALRTASSARRVTAKIRYSKISERILEIFANEGFILNVTQREQDLIVDLNHNFPINSIVQCSVPGNPSYITYNSLRAFSWAIVSNRASLCIWPRTYRGNVKGGLILVGIKRMA